MQKAKQKHFLIVSILFLVALAALFPFAHYAFNPTAGPLIGAGDAGAYDFGEYFFFTNLKWLPVPHLTLRTDMLLYPYGMDFVAAGWMMEKHYFTYFLTTWFGHNSWQQWYGVWSAAVTFLGMFFLLKKDYGTVRSWLAAIAATFLNFAAIYKFPGHQNLSMLHWCLLSIIADFLLTKRWYEKKLTLQFLGVKALFLWLSLGMDIGFIAGFALTSFTTTVAWIVVREIWEWRKNRSQNFSKFTHELMRPFAASWKMELKQHTTAIAALVFANLFVAWAFLPVLIQVASTYGRYQWSGGGRWWATPLRLFLPWFPGFNPAMNSITDVLQDSPELPGNMSPGWTIVIPAMLGIAVILRTKRKEFYPILAFAALLILNHPAFFSVVRVFPWWHEVRVAGRLSLVFPAIGALLALEGSEFWKAKKWFIPLFLLIPIIEWHTFTTIRPQPNGSISTELAHYMDTIKATPGEALLEWPFCVKGGDGVGWPELCPAGGRNETTFGLERLHEKKLINVYLGRIAESQVEPLRKAGWNFLLAAGTTRCWNAHEWEYVEQYLRNGSFAGIQFYPELVSPTCREEFLKRFGQPSVTSQLPAVGRIEFFKKPQNWRGHENIETLKNMSFTPILPPGKHNLANPNATSEIFSFGLSELIAKPFWPTPFLLMRKNPIQLRFGLDAPKMLHFKLGVLSSIAGQRIKIFCNDKLIHDTEMKASQEEQIVEFSWIATPGNQEIRISATIQPSLLGVLSEFSKQNGIEAVFTQPLVWHRMWTRTARSVWMMITQLEVGSTE